MPTLRRSALVVLPAAVAFSGLGAGVAHAASCAQSGAVVTINVSGESITLARAAGGQILLNGAPCATATVSNTDSIVLGGLGGGMVTLDLTMPLEPGPTPEPDGLAEVEVVWDTNGTALRVLGAAGNDDIRRGLARGVHLNGDHDPDVQFNAAPASVLIDGRGGDDFIDMSRTYSDGTLAWPVQLTGGTGHDVLRGDAGQDAIAGGDGNDWLADGLGDDAGVSGGLGDDVLQAGRTQQGVASDGFAAVPDSGAATRSMYLNGVSGAADVEVRLTVKHPDASTLTVRLTGPDGTSAVLASGRPGTGLVATLFDDAAASSITSGSGTYTGRYRPAEPIEPLFATQGAGGYWTLTVSDGTADGLTGSLHGWSMHAVGALATGPDGGSTNGADSYDGGAGTDQLSFAGRQAAVTFDATTTTSGTAGEWAESDAYTGIESLTGGSAGDQFNGSPGNDVFNAGPGFDRIRGAAGDDDIDCGDDGDIDVLDLSDAPEGVTVDLVLGVAVGNGTDAVTSCDGVVGTSFRDVVKGHDGPNHVVGYDGDDEILLYGGADSVDPGSGADAVDTGADGDRVYAVPDGSADTFRGGEGGDDGDWIDYRPSVLPLRITLDDRADDGAAGEGDDVGSDFELVEGGSAADHIVGSEGDNSLNGHEGDDVIDGGGGTDYVTGGAGTDTWSFASAPAGVTATLAGNVASGDGAVVASEVEDLLGSAHGDVLTGDSGPNVIRPGAGDDTVVSGAGDDRLVAEPAPDGADTWTAGDGTDTADYSLRTAAVSVTLDDEPNDGAAGEGDTVPNGTEAVRGGAGDDAVVGGIEANTFHGGGGHDTLLGRGGADVLNGDDGNDSLLGSSGDDVLAGGIGNDSLSGGDGDDRLRGGDGDDTLLGGTGDDDEFGEGGSDRFVQGDTAGANGSDLLAGGAAADSVTYLGRAAGVAVTVNGVFDDGAANEGDSVGRDVETVTGTAYADRLTGNELASTLRGEGGNDTLTGGAGNDTLDGGAGNDTFAEGGTASGADSMTGGSGVDVADYRSRTAALTVDLDNVADDGAAGEKDNVRSDVENVSGGSGGDTLTGSGAANRLAGYGGADTLTGGTAADVLDGGDGNDTLYARDAVKDTLYGGAGTDRARRDAVDLVSAVESYF